MIRRLVATLRRQTPEQKAMALLMAHLSPAQRRQVRSNQFSVCSPDGNKWTVPMVESAPLSVNGRALICLSRTTQQRSTPWADVALTAKLMIETGKLTILPYGTGPARVFNLRGMRWLHHREPIDRLANELVRVVDELGRVVEHF